MAANQYKVKRVNIAFTDADKDNIQSVRAAHGFPTDTAAIRWALDICANRANFIIKLDDAKIRMLESIVDLGGFKGDYTSADDDPIQQAIEAALEFYHADMVSGGKGMGALYDYQQEQAAHRAALHRLLYNSPPQDVDACECEAADAEVHAQFKARQNNSPPAYPPPLINTGVHLRAERADAITEAECGATDGVAVDCDSADYEAENICGFCIHQRRQNRLQSAAEWARRKA